MKNYEQKYADLIKEIMDNGVYREGRNGGTKSIFGHMLSIDLGAEDTKGTFPLLQGRRSFYKGVFGELAAMMRKPKHLEDFEKFGCNYWKLWAKEDGSINVDYGNAWHEHDQINRLKDTIINNPSDRRMLISGWRPENLDDLDLPCCHLLYQFYVADGKISMNWYQRSADVMIGLPSDVIFAAAWLISVANFANLEPGKINLMLGDSHIYEEHFVNVPRYLDNVEKAKELALPMYTLNVESGKDFCEFVPEDIVISDYQFIEKLDFLLKE